MADVEAALHDGTLNGKTHSEPDIIEMKQSGVFRKRYSKYIENSTFSPGVIRHKVGTWADKYLGKVLSSNVVCTLPSSFNERSLGCTLTCLV